MQSFLDIFQRNLAGTGHVGCTTDEIAQLQTFVDFPLPEDYQHFLRLAGRKCKGFCVGSSFEYPELLELQEGGEELMAENSLPPLGRQYFVILMHQGYQFFALAKDGVYYYYEGRDSLSFEFNTFGEWFEQIHKEWSRG